MANGLTIDQARSRIQALVEEIGALSKAELTSEQFFQKYLDRVVAATDARGGAVWLGASRGPQTHEERNDFQLCAQVNFDSSLFPSDETQRGAILRILADVVKSRRALVLAAADLTTIELPAEQPIVNKTPFAFLHVPFFLNDQPLGVLQVWLKADVSPKNYSEFVTFLNSLTGFIEQHLQSRRLGSLVLETQRLQHLLRFSGDIAGSLDATEIARLTVNHARDLIGCERTALLLSRGRRWSVAAISGQETVEKKSALVKSIAAFVALHSTDSLQVLGKSELLDSTGGEQGSELPLALRQSDEIDLDYFQLSHVTSAAIAPILDDGGKVFGALFCESASEDFFVTHNKGEPPASLRLADWISKHSGKALLAARDHQSLPFLSVSRKIRRGQLLLTSDRRRHFLLKLGLALAAIIVAAAWPVMQKVDANCAVTPSHRASIVPEIAGRVEKILVREGDQVHAGQPVAQIDIRRLQTDLDASGQETLRYLAEADRYRALGDEGSAQVAMLQSKIAVENGKKLQADIASGTLRSPIDGVVMTKELETRAGEFLQPGSVLLEVAGVDHWDLQLEVNERKIGGIEKALASNQKLPLTYILYAHPAERLTGTLSSRLQLGAVASPREKENVFLITLHDPPMTSDLVKSLRPGLTGRAKIALGRKPLIVRISASIADWFRMHWIG